MVMMVIMLMKKITLVTSLEEISMSVLGISSKLRTHSRDFTWRPMLKDMLTKVNNSRVNLEEGELLLGEGPNGAGDEGALGEAAVELG